MSRYEDEFRAKSQELKERDMVKKREPQKKVTLIVPHEVFVFVVLKMDFKNNNKNYNLLSTNYNFKSNLYKECKPFQGRVQF